MDGTLGSQTAWLLDGSGVRITSGDELAEIVRAAAAAGWPVCGPRDRRPGQPRGARRLRGDPRRLAAARASTPDRALPVLAPEDVRRFAALGVACSVQFSHAPSDRDLADRFWAGKTAGAYAFRSLWDSGALVANGSDAPVEELDPLAGIRAGVLRTIDGRAAWHPEQTLTIEQALARRRPSTPPGSPVTSAAGASSSPATSPISSSSRATRSRARPTSSRRSRSSPRWSAAAGCTTPRPGDTGGTMVHPTCPLLRCARSSRSGLRASESPFSPPVLPIARELVARE